MVFVGLCVPFMSLAALWMLSQQSTVSAQSQTDSQDKRCESCHREISDSYRTTAMATASGPAREGITTAEFSHKESGVHYRVYLRDGEVWMSYAREGKDAIRGERELVYFIGSGKKGRTYLFSEAGYWFEAPINWYSQEGRWNMTPAYTQAREIPLNLPAYVDCLNCHASGVQAPVAGTDSKFVGKPFEHGGISCERCHGSGEQHEGGKGPIVNPATLPAERRDAICMECHFEGTVAVAQAGKHLYQFRPGDPLSDYMHYFLLTADPHLETPQALSQFEAFSLSACKKASGDKMWCGTCHDSHREPSTGEEASYYRAKCLACHGEAFAAKHHPEKPDCRPCHMPALPSKDVAHTEGTDHRILRFPMSAPLPRLQVRGKWLTAFPASNESLVTARDYALAWESLAQRGLEGAAPKAEDYLRKAVEEIPNDPALLTALGFVEQQHKQDEKARELYERALKIDPLANEAATDLGILEAKKGNLRQAVELWQAAFLRTPNRSAIGMNLAIAFCVAEQKDVAKKYVQRVLEFNPDFGKAKSLLANLDKDPVQCKP